MCPWAEGRAPERRTPGSSSLSPIRMKEGTGILCGDGAGGATPEDRGSWRKLGWEEGARGQEKEVPGL